MLHIIFAFTLWYPSFLSKLIQHKFCDFCFGSNLIFFFLINLCDRSCSNTTKITVGMARNSKIIHQTSVDTCSNILKQFSQATASFHHCKLSCNKSLFHKLFIIFIIFLQQVHPLPREVLPTRNKPTPHHQVRTHSSLDHTHNRHMQGIHNNSTGLHQVGRYWVP